VLAELSTLGGSSSAPYGIGRNGTIVGTAETAEAYDEASKVQRPVAWEAGSARDLGTLGGPLGAATAMNASGLIVGASQREPIDPALGRRPMRACAWEGEKIRDLGDLGGPESVAYDVNERGWIVGSSMTSSVGSEQHAFLHDGRTMHDLGTLGGASSFAWAINERGEVVGYSSPVRSTTPGRLSWRAFVWRDGKMTDLGTRGGRFSEALDVNDRGDIVGWSRLANGVDHALLWSSGEMLDLNDGTRARRDCVLTRATAITDDGAILADVRCGGRPRVALLTPAADVDVAGRAR
jgi:probable HAF family extracellular repeat protein